MTTPPEQDVERRVRVTQEQAIACLKCGAAEAIREDSDRLPHGHWPAWEPGPQKFPCPACGESNMIWAAAPRDIEEPAEESADA